MLSIVWDTEALGWRTECLIKPPYGVAEASDGVAALAWAVVRAPDDGSKTCDGVMAGRVGLWRRADETCLKTRERRRLAGAYPQADSPARGRRSRESKLRRVF